MLLSSFESASIVDTTELFQPGDLLPNMIQLVEYLTQDGRAVFLGTFVLPIALRGNEILEFSLALARSLSQAMIGLFLKGIDLLKLDVDQLIDKSLLIFVSPWPVLVPVQQVIFTQQFFQLCVV